MHDLLHIRDFHSVSCAFPDNFYLQSCTTISPTTPMCKHTGLGSSAFARHYLRNHQLFSLPLPTQMFQFRRFDSLDYSSSNQVSPFGHLRISVRLQLPVAFRSFPRPSYPSRAKASPVRPYSLPYLYMILILNKLHAFTLHNLFDFSTCFSYFFSLSMNFS